MRKRLTLVLIATLIIAGISQSQAAPTPPKANNIVVSPTTVAPGGTVTVTFNVTSSSDGGTNSIVQFSAPSGANYGGVYAFSAGTPRDRSWSVRIQIPATAEGGKYSLSISVPFDANGLSGGFVNTRDAIWVGTDAEKAALDKASADKIAADKAAADKAAADKAAADKAASELIAKQEAEAKAAAQKKITITCVKGKLSKKVTALKPKCPTGYKVKK
jgi:hypothetical protein